MANTKLQPNADFNPALIAADGLRNPDGGPQLAQSERHRYGSTSTGSRSQPKRSNDPPTSAIELPEGLQQDVYTASTALVRRPRLLDALDRTLAVRLVLVTAPGGYGKSVLVRDWATRQSHSVIAWIDLDRRDNDATRMWQRILETVDAGMGPLPEEVHTLGSGRSGELERSIDALVAFLGQSKESLIIILDDFHLIRSPLAVESFEYFRDSAPQSIGVVLIGRQDPPLGVARLRVLDDLLEIRERDLRLTPAEIEEIAEGSGLMVDAEAVAHLHTISSGWAAAVRMAILTASISADPSAAIGALDVHDRALSDFFSEEVLSDMPGESREFLLSTSILDRVNASIASSVSAVEDAADRLQDLAERSILTTRLSGSGDWFRYHELFRQLLMVLLNRSRSEEEIRQLHRRAAQWYAENEDSERAIPHWLAAGDIESATEAVTELSPLLMAAGRAATLLDLSEQVIDAVDHPTIVQLVCKGEALHALGADPRELDRMIGYIEDQLDGAAESVTVDPARHAADPRSWESPSALPWVRSVRLRRRGKAVELVGMNRPDIVPSPSRAVEYEIAEGLIWLERYSEAEAILPLAMERADENGYVPHIVHNLGLLATSLAGRGRFDESEATAERALALCHDHGLGLLRQTMYARLNSAWTKWRRGDIQGAESSALDVQEFAETAADVPITVQHAELRSSIRWSLGDRVGAHALLDRATVTATGAPISGYFRDRLRFAKARIDLLDADHGSALLQLPDWRTRIESGPTTLSEWLVLMQLASAADGPKAILEASFPAGFSPSIVHELAWRRLTAHALDLVGERQRAVNELSGSLETAVRLSLLQPMLDEQTVLGSLLPLAVEHAGVELPGLVVLEDAQTPRPVYVEPLTGREQEVLEYMATHLSYPEIAAELYVSNNTVKTHTRAVFRKLAVSKRADAVARARFYALIG
jgi:LuxR family maltose regulon positive regulatory protein